MCPQLANGAQALRVPDAAASYTQKQKKNAHKFNHSQNGEVQRPPRGRGGRRRAKYPALACFPCGAPSPPQKPDSAPSESHVHPYDPGRSDPWLGRGCWIVCRWTAGKPKSRRMNCPRVSACSKSTFPRTIPCPRQERQPRGLRIFSRSSRTSLPNSSRPSSCRRCTAGTVAEI